MSSPKKTSKVTPISLSEPLLLDLKAAARALSCHVWAVRELLWSKEIPFIRIGRGFLIDPADLRAFISRRKAGGE